LRSSASRPAARPRRGRSRLALTAIGLIVLGASAQAVDARADHRSGEDPTIRPSIHYEEAVAHASDRIEFAPGGRVTVGFSPRRGDRWTVGGTRPVPLPAGRRSGAALRVGSAALVDQSDRATSEAVGPVDGPTLDPASVVPAQPAAAVDPGGLKREVFGFLPYWELTDSSTTLDWEKLSTVAYFGVGASKTGDLQRTNSDGSTSVGWSGWTSARMTGVIEAAHANGARVVLTVQSFAWTSAGADRQKKLLGSSANRANLARQIAAAVRDRGADGVNLDFEPIAATYADEFAALVRKVRTELDKVHRGYQLTFDATGWIGNYPIEDGTASGAADAVIIMGYDYRTASSATVGSIAPLGGPTYDVRDTLDAYLSRIPPSKVILGVPYYGRAWSTKTSELNSRNISGTKNGASASVVYTTARQYAADHGKLWDPVESVAWTVYRRQNCTATYGCVNPWRQLYFDDAKALKRKYDMVNQRSIRGVGIWALGYDGTRTELYQALKDKFITDTIPPVISSSSLSSTIVSPNGDGRFESTTMSVTVTGQLTFGWLVEPYVDGSAGPKIVSGSSSSKTVRYTWDGRNGSGKPVADGPYRITIWTADASDNRASVSRTVTVDSRPAAVSSAATPGSISPDGDGHADRSTLSFAADEGIKGKARIVDRDGATVRGWKFSRATSGSWVWNGRDLAGDRVRDDRYTFRVKGRDGAGNLTIRDMVVRVDRTIKSASWSRTTFTPKAGQRDRLTFALRRKATVTVAIYQGSVRIRTLWSGRDLSSGSHSLRWNGKAGGAYVTPGRYKVVISATSRIGPSSLARPVVVKAP
jgi:spore germination protein YaaH/flagellar hook assembly protein FlgD